MEQEKQWAKSRNFREALVYAWRGIINAVRSEPNVRRELVIGGVVLILALFLRLPASQLAIILVIGAVVLTMEMLNSALEAVADVIHPQYHEAIRRGKDIAAGAILVAAITAITAGMLLLGPPLWAFLVG